MINQRNNQQLKIQSTLVYDLFANTGADDDTSKTDTLNPSSFFIHRHHDTSSGKE